MEEQINYAKRTQKDYTLSLKIQVVKEIESGELSVTASKKSMEYKAMLLFWVGSGNMVTLIGRIKHQQICQRHLNDELWSLRPK